jgi:hypothetical protein
MTRFSKLLATALLFAGTTPAFAAPVAATPQAKGKALILRPLSFVRVNDLDFGTVVSSSVAGTVTINATSGARSIAGGVTPITVAPGGRGYFAGAGSPSQQVIINLTPATVLTNALGDTIAVATMGIDGATTRTIDPTTLTFYVGVGGTILVAANQPDGDYESTFDITADYQ